MSNDKIANLLIIVLGVMLCILVILVLTFIFLKVRSKRKEKSSSEKDAKVDDNEVSSCDTMNNNSEVLATSLFGDDIVELK